MNVFLRRGLVISASGCAVLLALACGDDDKVCQPNAQQYCACAGGQGVQVCSSDGSTWSTCDCSGAGGSGGTGPSGPQDGAPCTSEGELVCGWDAAGTDDDQILYCDGSTYERVFECPPMQDCGTVTGHTTVRCGTGDFIVHYAIVDHPCALEGSASCTFDQTQVLICEQGMWEVYDECGTEGLKCQHVEPGWSSGSRTCPITSENGCTVCA